ncbi:MAG: ATP-binding protein [Bacteroidales bacterium]|nr:ATP-binding protein [Bacteroidales bacterium]
MREKLNILIHGEPKSGKTTFAVRKNPGVLILDTEGSSKLVKGVKREVITSMAQMDVVLNRIKSGEVTTVVIDTLDELVNNFAKQETVRKGGDNVQTNGQLTIKGYGVLRDRFLTLTRAYRDAGADVLTICHSELVEKPEGGKKWAMKLPSDYAREVMAMMDVVGFLEVARTGKEDVRRVHFRKTPHFDAGCRLVYDAVEDKRIDVLPPHVDDPSLIDVIRAYDNFFDGDGRGYLTCGACKVETATQKAVSPKGNEYDLCDKCCAVVKAKWEEETKEPFETNNPDRAKAQ